MFQGEIRVMGKKIIYNLKNFNGYISTQIFAKTNVETTIVQQLNRNIQDKPLILHWENGVNPYIILISNPLEIVCIQLVTK